MSTAKITFCDGEELIIHGGDFIFPYEIKEDPTKIPSPIEVIPHSLGLSLSIAYIIGKYTFFSCKNDEMLKIYNSNQIKSIQDIID